MAAVASLLLPLLLRAASATALVANPPHFPDDTEFTVRRMRVGDDISMPTPIRLADSELRVTEHVVRLKREDAVSVSSMYVQAMRKQAWARTERDVRLGAANVPLLSVEAGQVFLAPITVGAQSFYVVIDTGSADPWLVNTEFICADPYSHAEQDEEYCYFGPPYDRTKSNTYTPIPNENFNITYADGEQLNGDMAFESMSMGGITVPRQKFAIVDYAAWYGDGYSSGLVGFAYGTLTNAYAGVDPKADRKGATLTYNPLFANMYNQSLVAPIFSLAIDRDQSAGGVLALGGIPAIPHTPGFVSVPIQSVGVFAGTTTPAYEFYTVFSDGWAIAASTSTQFNPYPNRNPLKTNLVANGSVVVDSGTSLIYAPNIVADTVASLFRPPAAFDSAAGAYYVPCNAISPALGVSIARKIFYVNGKDLVVPASGGRCILGVQPNYGGLTILGDVWMKSVLCVFDIGASQMRFAARQFYGLVDTPKPRTT